MNKRLNSKISQITNWRVLRLWSSRCGKYMITSFIVAAGQISLKAGFPRFLPAIRLGFAERICLKESKSV
jgi:hypothetical protein